MSQELSQSLNNHQAIVESCAKMEKEHQDLHTQLIVEKMKVQQLEEGSKHVTDLETMLKEQQEEAVKLTKERDSARAKILQIQGQNQDSNNTERDAEIVQANRNMKLELKAKDEELKSKEVDIADLKSQVTHLEEQLRKTAKRRAQNVEGIDNYGANNDGKQTELLQGQAQKQETITNQQEQIKRLQEQLASSHSCGVDSPTEQVGGGVSFAVHCCEGTYICRYYFFEVALLVYCVVLYPEIVPQTA